MIKKIVCTAIVLGSFFCNLGANIVEIAEISRAKDFIEKDTLLLLNVGDTLFSPSSMLADNQWREYFVNRVKLKISDPVKAQLLINKVKGLIVEKIPKLPPEEITPAVIREFQEENVPVLGYTQRFFSTSYAENNGLITGNHLLGMGIDLQRTLSYFSVPEYDYSTHVFKYGILFTNKAPLGPAFKELLLNCKTLPSKVIVVDDSMQALEGIEACLVTIGVEFQGLRYGRIDERKNAFDSEVATLQFFAYINEGLLLTDDEAIQIRKLNPEVIYETILDEWIVEETAKA